MNRRWWSAGLSGVLAAVLLGGLTACAGGASTAAPPTTTAHKTSAAPKPFVGALPKGCDPVATMGDVDKAIGHPLDGTSNLVIGIPEAAIDRTGRLDCYYGIPPNQAATAGVLSIGIAAYTTDAVAAHRVLETVNEGKDTGYTTTNTKVGAQNAVLLSGARQEIVLAAGDLTILVAAANGVLPQGNTAQPLVALANRALNATSAAATPTTTPTPTVSATTSASATPKASVTPTTK